VSRLTAMGVTVAFGHGRRRVLAVRGVDLTVAGGETLGIVGESGSGKSTLARALAGLTPLAAGRIELDGQQLGPRRRRDAARRIQLVFQDPAASLSPSLSVEQLLGDALAAAGVARSRRSAHITELLDAVGLTAVRRQARPRELSGGQRQRVALARALGSEPEILICDEVTSALDVSARGAMLNLLGEVQRERNLGLLFISHDIAAVRHISERVAVMYLGGVVEQGDGRAVVAAPRHPYTAALVAAVPRLGGGALTDLDEDAAPDPRHPPSGCPFHPRCARGPLRHPERRVCVDATPVLTPAGAHAAACHFASAPPARTDSQPTAT
jgi:peptide/nickel transport system ATP-binding protein